MALVSNFYTQPYQRGSDKMRVGEQSTRFQR